MMRKQEYYLIKMLSVRQCVRALKNRVATAMQIKQFFYQEFKKPENFETFCRFILPKAFTKPFGEFHKEIVNDFMKEKNSAVAAPRGSGKSTIIGQGFVMWNILYKKKKYIVYTSQNHMKSTQFLEPIRYEIKVNERLRFIYGVQNITLDKDENNKDREDMFDVDGVRIHALSFEKNIRGLKHGNQRPDLIILDDIEDDARVMNPELRRKDSDKLDKQIIPSLDTERGVIKYLGTILHHDSLLVKKINLFGGKIYKACKFMKDGSIDPDSLLFPAMFTVERLLKIKHDIGSTSFQSEYLNEPIDDTASIIKREHVMACFCEELSFFGNDNYYQIKYLGVDFAFSDRIKADKSAYVGIGVTEEGYDIIACITKKGLTITPQLDYIEMINGQYRFTDCALEENSIQNMSRELKNYSFPYTLFWTAGSDPAVKKPVSRAKDYEYEDKRHTIGKVAMIHRLATRFENGRIRIPFKTAQDKVIAYQILDECCSYATQDGKLVEVGVHPDIPIALGYASERAEMDRSDFAYGSLEM